MLTAPRQDVLSPTAPTATTATTAAAPAAATHRLVSLDVMRGLTIAGMILVTDPGTYSAVFPPLLHAAWQGATPTDMIFPAFYDLHHLRIPGILQRIALCYAAAALLYLAIGNVDKAETAPPASAQSATTRPAAVLVTLIAAILIGYWALLRYVPVPDFGPARYDSLGYLGAYIDCAVFTTGHLWAWGLTPGHGVTYDPEGLLSTIPAIANTLLGVFTGVWLRMPRSARSKVADLLCFGALLFLVAWPLTSFMPINKRIWTSTFALLSGGVSLLAFGLLYWILDVRATDGRGTDIRAGVRSTDRNMPGWLKPAIGFAAIFGTNAILAFVLSSIITASLDAIHLHISGAALSLHHAGYQYLFAPWLPPRLGSLAYALAIVALNAALLYPLYRKRIFLRI